MDDVYDDPLHGPLTLERSMNATGYKEVNKKVNPGGRTSSTTSSCAST